MVEDIGVGEGASSGEDRAGGPADPSRSVSAKGAHPSRVPRPRAFSFHMTEGAYAYLAHEAARRKTTKAVILRETLNKGQRLRRDELAMERMREAIEDLCYQFASPAYKNRSAALSTSGLSALEEAFDILGWDDPHRTPDLTCNEPYCWKHATCGTPTGNGYRRLCSEHYMALTRDSDTLRQAETEGLGAKQG